MIKPMGPRILLRPIFKDPSAGGIMLPDVPTLGIVMDVGSAVSEVQIGDMVMLPRISAGERWEADRAYLIHIELIVAKVEKDVVQIGVP